MNKIKRIAILFLIISTIFNFIYSVKALSSSVGINNLEIKKTRFEIMQLKQKVDKLKNNKDSFYIVDKFIDDLIHEKVIPRIRMTYNSSDIDYLYENILYFYKKGLRFVVAHHNSYDDWCLDDVYRLKKEIAKLKSFFYY